jgi:adenylyltransferase/sulfurtransferase
MVFSEEQLQRYSRHLSLPVIGKSGQKKISEAKVLLVGIGGLGSSAGYYLAAAGAGTLTLIDDDLVELSNLQRQIAHTVQSLGRPKVASASETFRSLNPDVQIITINGRLKADTVCDVMRSNDIVVDCSDNFPTRFLVNDACVRLGKPLVIGAVSGFEGQVTTVIPGDGPCYRCLFEAPPDTESPDHEGIVGVVPGIIGVLQATEVLKLILGIGEVLKGELLIYHALTATFRKMKIARRPDCSACSI